MTSTGGSAVPTVEGKPREFSRLLSLFCKKCGGHVDVRRRRLHGQHAYIGECYCRSWKISSVKK